jgi:hypothetical protein
MESNARWTIKCASPGNWMLLENCVPVGRFWSYQTILAVAALLNADDASREYWRRREPTQS